MAMGGSAGLAHELNNPAAGANRATNGMILVLAGCGPDLRLCRHEPDQRQEDAIHLRRRRTRHRQPGSLIPLNKVTGKIWLLPGLKIMA